MVSAPQAPAADEAPYIVVLKDSVSAPGAVAQAQTEQRGGDVGFVYRYALKGYSATLSASAVEALRRDPRVDFVERDKVGTVDAQTTPTGIKRIFAPTNTLLSINEKDDERANVDIAVIDTGVNTHGDLNVFKRTNCIPPNKDKEPEVKKCVDGEAPDENEHGTHVAGTAAAIDNGEGVVGVAPGARIWGAKVFTLNAKKENVGFESWFAAGVDWVTSNASEIEVANMSFGCGPLKNEKGELIACEQKALDKAIKTSIEKGVVYVASAGNLNVDAKYRNPANNPEVITVSAIADYNGAPEGEAAATCGNGGKDDESANFSNWGATIEIAAPGVCILSTVPGGGYVEYSGTSMATPHVAGAAAIVASESNPENKGDVEAIVSRIIKAGNTNWKDVSGDGVKEPLLDVHDEGFFNMNG